MRHQSLSKIEMDPGSVRLIGSTILVRCLSDETVKSGIIIPDSSKNKAKRGIVVSKGPKAPEEAVTGSLAILHSYAVIQASIKWEGAEYAVYNGDDVMAIGEGVPS